MVSPVSGNIVQVYAVIDEPITTANTVITLSIAGINVSGGVITIPYVGSAPGNAYFATPNGANSVSAGSTIKLAISGGSGGNAFCHIALLIDRTI